MKVKCLQHFEHLQDHLHVWQGLLDQTTECSSIFLTPAWVCNWWDNFNDNKQLAVLMLYSEKELVGIAPLAIHKNGLPFHTLRFIGTGVADHLDFCILPEFRQVGIARFIEYIVHELSWDVMDLVDVPEDSENVQLISQALAKHNLKAGIERTIACPYLTVNGQQWETFYSQRRSKSSRQELRRRFRRLAELGPLEFCHYSDPIEVKRVFPQLFSVYEKRWAGKNLSISFAGKKERLFYPNLAADLAQDGRLHLLTLELDRKVIAYTLSAKKGSQFTWLSTAYDPEYDKFFPGELVLTRLLEDVFNNHTYREFDFTRGEEPYKYKWTETERFNLRILASNKGFLAKIPYYSLFYYTVCRREAKKSSTLRKIKLDTLGRIKSLLKQSSSNYYRQG